MATADDYAKWIVDNQDKKGTPEFDVVAKAYQLAKIDPKPKQEKGFGAKLSEGIADIPRQLGLTARAGIEGIGQTVGMFAEPLRLPMSKASAALGGPRIADAGSMATGFADMIGLPQPQGSTERIAGDVVRTMTGGAGLMGAAQKAAPALSGVAQNVATGLASNPMAQTGAAVGSGAAGGYTRETGGGDLAQFLASVVGGIGGGYAGKGLNTVAQKVDPGIKPPPPSAPPSVELVIERALGNGAKFSDLAYDVQQSLKNDVAKAMQLGDLSPAAMKRLIDYRLAGATPTRAGLTLDPVDITQQRNLEKVGANSNSAAVQELARARNANAKTLGAGVDELAGGVLGDRYINSAKALGGLESVDAMRKGRTDQLYAAARDSLGRAAPLDPATATQNAGVALAEKMAGGLLPAKAQSYLNDIATGKIPFNVDTKEQIVRNLGSMARGAPPDEAYAIGLVRKALDDAPLLETHGLGPDAMEAFKAARASHAQRMQAQEATPALKAAAEGVQPDRFFETYVLGSKGNVQDLQNMVMQLGPKSEGTKAIKGQLVRHLMEAGNVNPETGTFNQKSFNDALRSIGDAKLSVFLTKPEIEKIKAIGRVALNEQVQPQGSAVNNSNTASAAYNLLERIAGSSVLNRVPFAGDIASGLLVRAQAGQAGNIPKALMMPTQKELKAPILTPALAGLLAMPQDERRKGLLAQ